VTALVVRVPGIPVPQGSLRALGAGRPTVHANAAALKPWRATVIAHLQDEMHHAGDWPLDGPVSVRLTFVLPRPKSAPKSRTWPDKKPDIDRLTRAALDSLTQSGAVHDDAQVCHLEALKAYGVPGMVLTLRPLGADATLRLHEETA
jgi:crossover junction endodeoxyribonuclease RusA